MTSTAIAVLGMLVLAGLCFILATAAIRLHVEWRKAMAEVVRLQRALFDREQRIDYQLLSSLERTSSPVVAHDWYAPTDDDTMGFDQSEM